MARSATRTSLGSLETGHATEPSTARASARTTAAAVTAGAAHRAAARDSDTQPGYRRAFAAFAGHRPDARPDFAGRLAPQPSRSDDRFEVRQGLVVIVRFRGIEEDQVEAVVDHRADCTPSPP